MTENLNGRTLDLALAEATDAPCDRWIQGWSDRCGGSRGSHPTRHEYQPPYFHESLDLIAAAEEPLRKAGWEQDIEWSDGASEVVWYAPLDHFSAPSARATTPDEVTARGNAAYRALLMLKEEQG